MRALRLLRPYVIVMMLALMVAIPVMTQPAGAATGRGTVAIHSRICGDDATQLFDDCHGNPGPAGAMYKIDNRVPKPIVGGNVSFGRAFAGDHLVTLTSGLPSRYSSMRAFCSNSVGGSGVNEATILYSDTPQFWVRLAAGSRLTCDVYFIP